MRLLVFGTALLLGATLVFATGACGGGGGAVPGAGVAPVTLCNGPYFYQAFAGDDGPPAANGWAWWGSMTGNGAGMVTAGQLNWNHVGAIGNTPFAPLTYTVAADGTLGVAGGSFLGGVSPSGAFAAVAGDTTGGTPSMDVLFR